MKLRLSRIPKPSPPPLPKTARLTEFALFDDKGEMLYKSRLDVPRTIMKGDNISLEIHLHVEDID